MKINTIAVSLKNNIHPIAQHTQENKQNHNSQFIDTPLNTHKAYSLISFQSKKNKPKTIIIMLGAPNSGKGTYSNRISKEYGLPQISTGNILGEEVKKGSKLGTEVKSIMERGGLVDDELVMEVFKKRIAQPDCKKGFILDGFPRTIAQAEKLSEMIDKMPNIKLKVLNLDVPKEVLYARSATRMVCSDCSKTFDTKNYKSENCDENGCSGVLIKRKDDTPEILTSRLAEYEEKTAPLATYYSENGFLKNLKIAASVEKDCDQNEVFNNLMEEID